MNFISKLPPIIGNHIIQFLTDVDLYKLTMLQFILHQFPNTTAKYKFKNRTKNVNLAKYVDEINAELDWLCTLRFQSFELTHLKSIPFFTPDFVYFLQLFQLNRNWIKVYVDKNGELAIEAEGPWLHVMMFEVYVLAIVEEVYTRNEFKGLDLGEGRKRLNAKIKLMLDFTQNNNILLPIADFGTRRRFSYQWHEEVISTLVNGLPRDVFIGTSNVLFSNIYNIKYIGTMAHEIFQAGQALGPRPIHSQSFILDRWAKEYRGNLGIALTDTMGFDKFLKDFDMYFAKLYDGGRHDSADPYKWVDDFINHYKGFKIDPLTKQAVYSDGLNVSKIIDLAKYSHNRIKYGFGWGTDASNDVGVSALQLVMKIVLCNNSHVAKISDNPAKGMCESQEYESSLKREIKEDLKSNNTYIPLY